MKITNIFTKAVLKMKIWIYWS